MIARCMARSRRWRRRFAPENSTAKWKNYERKAFHSGAARRGDELQGLASGSRAADADEQSRSGSGGGSGPLDRLWRHGARGAELGSVRCHRAFAARIGKRRDAPRAIGETGGRVSHARGSAARLDCELESGRAMVELCGVQPTRAARPHDVWPDDGGLVDLHRQPGNRAGDVRDVQRGGGAAFRRFARREVGRLRRAGRNGRRAAAGGDDGGRGFSRGRCRSGADREAIEERLLR